MIKFSTLHKKWMKDPAYRKEYNALEAEFALIAEAAKTTGHRLRISFEPVKGKKRGSAHSRASGNPGMKSKDWR